MKEITISIKDLKDFRFSASGRVIDELAYCAGEWTEEDLWENNFEYEPREPYNFNYEADLFDNTKTYKQLYNLAVDLHVEQLPSMLEIANSGLQAGAYTALNAPEIWKDMLTAYTDRLKERGVDGISKDYNEELQAEIDSYYKNLRKEWLYGDYRDFAGVISAILKYFTEDREGDYNEAKDEFSFTLNDEEVEEILEGDRKTLGNIKRNFVQMIKRAGNKRSNKEKEEREKRREEAEKTKIYKDERKREEEARRKEKLLSMKSK